MSLRDDLIEAGAVELSKHRWPVRWGRRENIEACEVEARIAIDAVLDTLADRADEWDRQAGIAAMSHIDRLIAVLQGDT